jgi:hypothetical protein
MIADAHITVLRVADPRDAAFLCAFLQSPIGVQQLLRFRRGSSRQIELYPDDILTLLIPRVRKRTRENISRRWLNSVRAVQASAGAVGEAEHRIFSSLSTSRDQAEKGRGWNLSVGTLIGARRIDAEYCTPEILDLRNRIARAGAIPLSELILEAKRGLQPDAYAEGGSVHVIKSKDVHYPELDLSRCDRTAEEEWPYFLSGDEVLINMTGLGTLGRSTVVPRTSAQTMALIPAVDVMAIKVDPTALLPEYLALYLNSQIGRRLTTSLQTGSSGQQHLYPAHFSEIPVLLPRTASGEADLEWQRMTVELAEGRSSAVLAAQEVGRELDRQFLDELGVVVDLSTVPR